MAPQSELVRVVRTDDGDVVVGRTAPGRGAWLCTGNIECLDAAVKRKAFARALKGPVSNESLAHLRGALQQDVRG